jgi:hypothetical protein
MMIGQLAKSEGLRDLIVALEAHRKKLYYLGMGKIPKAQGGIKLHALNDAEAQGPASFH